MSKFVKNLIIKDIAGRFQDVDGVAVINPRGIDATKNNAIRKKLHAKGLKMMVVKNALARKAVGDGKLKGFDKLLEGPSAVVYGKASIATIARLLLDEKKTNDKLELRGVFFDGDLYEGDKGVKQASELPTREEAIGQVLSALLGAGSSVIGALMGPATTVASLVKAIEEKAEKAGGGDAAAGEAAAGEAAPAAAGA